MTDSCKVKWTNFFLQNSLSEIGARNDQFKDSLPIDDYNNLKVRKNSQEPLHQDALKVK